MSWQMPNAAQWNPDMGMNPNMNMGSYTADQWTAMQQQNWQQWSQWQQQYAQWHKQYGDKVGHFVTITSIDSKLLFPVQN